MGWSDEHEPPLTEEEVLSAKRDIETHRDMIETKKKAQSPTVLSPFPWVSRLSDIIHCFNLNTNIRASTINTASPTYVNSSKVLSLNEDR